MNLKNGSTASVRFGQIKKKLGWTSGAGGGRATSNRVTTTRSSSATPRKAPVAAGRPSARHADRIKKEKSKPPTRTRTFKAKLSSHKVKEESEDENEEADLSDAKKKKPVDLMDDSDEEEEEEDQSFEAKFNRGEYNEDGDNELDDDAVAQINQEYAVEEYDAYDGDEAFENAEEDVPQMDANDAVARQLSVPKRGQA